MASLEGKVALVTGGAMGLGKGIASVLLERGCKVAILDVDERCGEETADEFQKKFGQGNSVFIKCDVSKDEELEEGFVKTISLLGGLDTVVNNAGIQVPTAEWKKTFAINTEAVFHGTLLGIKYMGTDNGGKGGHVINIGSIAGIQVFPLSPSYCASKFAVVAMSRAFGTDLHFNRHGVKVSCFCPSFVDTPLYRTAIKQIESRVDQRNLLELAKSNCVSVEQASSGVLKLLEDNESGRVLIYTKEGLKYHEFQN